MSDQFLVSLVDVLPGLLIVTLMQGMEFWRLEREFAAQMLESETEAGMSCRREWMTISDIQYASSLKSFDYRVLNYVLHAIVRKQPDQTMMAFLRCDEMLVDIGDDLHDYEVILLVDLPEANLMTQRILTHMCSLAAEMDDRVYIAQSSQQICLQYGIIRISTGGVWKKCSLRICEFVQERQRNIFVLQLLRGSRETFSSKTAWQMC